MVYMGVRSSPTSSKEGPDLVPHIDSAGGVVYHPLSELLHSKY